MRRTDFSAFLGKKYGRLLVVGGFFKKGKAYFHCTCECGTRRKVAKYDVISGKVQSCGCYNRERCRTLHLSRRTFHYTHGMSNEKLYSTWCGMKGRCYNKNDTEYHNYGGRGIFVCDEWLHNYVAFRTWAFANGYEEGLSIDRIDVNKGYSPDNCRWITMREQPATRRNTIYYNGVPAVRIAREHGIPKGLMLARIRRLGWPIEEAIGLKPHKYPANWKGDRLSRFDVENN